MRTTVKTLGTTLAAAATVLATGTAAQAHGPDPDGHSWGDRHHDGWRHGDHRNGDHRSRSDHNHRGGPADLPDPAGTPGTGVTNAVNRHRHKAPVQDTADFQQRQAALVAELNGIDAQLARIARAVHALAVR